MISFELEEWERWPCAGVLKEGGRTTKWRAPNAAGEKPKPEAQEPAPPFSASRRPRPRGRSRNKPS